MEAQTQYSNVNKGLIGKNERKEKETHPDVKGSINIEGVEYWLDGWKRQRNDGTGSFYSLVAKPKEPPMTEPQYEVEFDAPRQQAPRREAPRQQPQLQGAYKPRPVAPRQPEFDDDEIDF